MLNIIVIGICVFLLFAVVFISVKPISMGIEARRNIKEDNDTDENDTNAQETNKLVNVSISEEISKLNELKSKGILNDEEYKKAKDKLLS